MAKARKHWLRTVVDIILLMLLAYGAWQERATIGDALLTIKNGRVVFVLCCLSLAWLNFIWSGVGYWLLVKKPIKLTHICLAHLAASGPGRIIPGGGGHMSFGVLFLRKHGHKTLDAVAISTTNNALGAFVNIAVVSALFLTHDYHLRTGNVHLLSGLVLAIIGIVCLLIMLVLSYSDSFAKWAAKVKKSYLAVVKRLFRHPFRLVLLVASMLATIGTHTLILYFAGRTVGLHVPLAEAMIVMSGGVTLGSLLPTPGGVGGVEAGLIATLYAFGYPVELATSTALLYRAATYLQPLLPGVAAYVWLRRHNEL